MSSHQNFESFIHNVERIKRNISETGVEQLKLFIEKNGIARLPEYIEDKLKEPVFINIAVTGSSGAGKSTFINAARGLTADDDGAAEVGVTQTTMTSQMYLHPENENIRFYDLPGIGTPDFRQSPYIGKFNLKKFDIVLLLSCGSFSENDLELADLALRNKIPFLFVKKKMTDAEEGDKKAHPMISQKCVSPEEKQRYRDSLCSNIKENINTALKTIRTERETKKSKIEKKVVFATMV